MYCRLLRKRTPITSSRHFPLPLQNASSVPRCACPLLQPSRRFVPSLGIPDWPLNYQTEYALSEVAIMIINARNLVDIDVFKWNENAHTYHHPFEGAITTRNPGARHYWPSAGAGSCHEALKGIIDGYMLPSTALYHLRPMPSHSANARRLGLDLPDHSGSQITSRKLEFANSNQCPIGNMGPASKAMNKAATNIPSLSRKNKSLLEATDTPTQTVLRLPNSRGQPKQTFRCLTTDTRDIH